MTPNQPAWSLINCWPRQRPAILGLDLGNSKTNKLFFLPRTSRHPTWAADERDNTASDPYAMCRNPWEFYQKGARDESLQTAKIISRACLFGFQTYKRVVSGG